MIKIAFIGAGSIVFGENLLTDIFTFPALRNETLICLEDIDTHRLDLIYRLMEKYKELYPELLEGINFMKTTNLEEAITDAKYIINTIHVGGLEAFKIDLDIPLKYGVSQCVGDTIGPGGVFRFLRNAPVMKEIIDLMKEIGYKSDKNIERAILLNYTNPMAMLTWYCNILYPDSTIGLCHGVQHTATMLQRWLNVPPENFSFLCAGINHMAWFLQLKYRNPNEKGSHWKNAYPRLKKLYKSNPNMIGGELLRWDMLEATGFFMTESTGHLSEYLPYYRKRKDLLEKYKGADGSYDSLLHGASYEMHCWEASVMERKFKRKLNKKSLLLKRNPSGEYAPPIMNARETGKLFRFNGNVINKGGGLIVNLPKECCVEVPIYVDYSGFHPQGGIQLPTVCQALCMSNIMVQKAAIEGLLNLDKELIYQAVLLDPNTASICSPKEVREMVDEMFDAEKQWISYFDI